MSMAEHKITSHDDKHIRSMSVVSELKCKNDNSKPNENATVIQGGICMAIKIYNPTIDNMAYISHLPTFPISRDYLDFCLPIPSS